jgi:hypothetical protein
MRTLYATCQGSAPTKVGARFACGGSTEPNPPYGLSRSPMRSRTADDLERRPRTGRAVTPCHTSETTGPAPNDSRRAFRTIANDIEPAVSDAGRRDYRMSFSDTRARSFGARSGWRARAHHGHSVAIADGSTTTVARASEPGPGRDPAGLSPRTLRRAILLRATGAHATGWLEGNERRTRSLKPSDQIRGKSAWSTPASWPEGRRRTVACYEPLGGPVGLRCVKRPGIGDCT